MQTKTKPKAKPAKRQQEAKRPTEYKVRFSVSPDSEPTIPVVEVADTLLDVAQAMTDLTAHVIRLNALNEAKDGVISDLTKRLTRVSSQLESIQDSVLETVSFSATEAL